MSRAAEAELRIYGVELIQRAAALLRLPQTTTASAAVVFQRFYFRRSLVEFDARVTAMAALLLATKLEETHRRLRDVVRVFHTMHLRTAASDDEGDLVPFAGGPTPALDPKSSEEMKRSVISTERQILQELGFAVAGLLEHPHKYVLQFVKSLRKSVDGQVRELAQSAWNYLNDSMRTTVCCAYQPHQIATAGIFLAARTLSVKLPKEPPWWAAFDTEPRDFLRIARKIVELYRMPQARYVSLLRRPAPSPQSGAEEEPRGGAAAGSAAGGQPRAPPGPRRSRSRSPAGGAGAAAAKRRVVCLTLGPRVERQRSWTLSPKDGGAL